MSKDFGIDNAGSGFDFDDDDEDLEAMLNKANEGEESSDDDDSHLAYMYSDTSKNDTAENASDTRYDDNVADSREIPATTQNAWEVIEPEPDHERVSENIPTYDNTAEVAESTDYRQFEEYKTPQEEIVEPEPVVYEAEPTPEPVPVPKPYDPAPAKVRRISSNYNTPAVVSPTPAPVEQTASRRFGISTEAEDIRSVQKTIRILDAYRKLNSKSIVAQLIYNENDVDPNDEAALVVKVLRADPMLGRMMTVLRESASEKDRVERVFYILNTDHDVLKYLGSFLETVSEDTFNDTQNHIAFAKELERTINQLDSKIVQHVADAQSVLVAAEDEKE